LEEQEKNVVARSNVELQYRVMTSTTYELVCLKQLLKELQFGDVIQITLIYDNQVVLYINFNLVFHERTKYISIDYHFCYDLFTLT